jgi:anthranilate/para-aminobenzoate synthase component I
MSGGLAVGFISYDLIRQYEQINPPTDAPVVPDIYLLFVNSFILHDPIKSLFHIVYNPAPLVEMGWPKDFALASGLRAVDEIEKVISDIALSPLSIIRPRIGKIIALQDEASYQKKVLRAKKYIAQGDIFQANLSHRFSASICGDSIYPLYQKLMEINKSPFSAYLNMGGVEIASCSPERLVRVKNGLVETRPIAGTCSRGLTSAEEQEKITAFYKNEKERAEHLMLVDLERNDIGKVARFGTVQVSEMMALERYSHVSHMVSNVVGTLRDHVLAKDVIRAMFPGGTITGVPKVRCMQIISELEGQTRGLYTGSIGMIDFSGEMDFNIVIRSFIRQGSELSFQVGAGIVADSDPHTEYQETRHKAAALIKVLEDV